MARGRGGSRGGGPITRDVQVSKKLSWLLRHGAEQEKLKLEKGGYVNLAEVLSNRNIKSLNPRPTLSEIRSIVASNEKQRFSLVHISALGSHGTISSADIQHTNPNDAISADNAVVSGLDIESDDEPSNYLIRANQGHSIQVESADLLTPLILEAGNLPGVVVHGTRHEHWPKIVASGGLKPMGRNHIHFATGVPESLQSVSTNDADIARGDEVAVLSDEQPAPVILSGMRNSSSILIFINLKLALELGIKFWLSENGVVLSEGDENGIVALRLFEKVEERGGRILVRDGVVVAEPDKSEKIVGGHGQGRGGGRRGRGKRV